MVSDNMPAQTKNTYGLLHTKLMPPRLHTGLLPRPALFDRLDQALKKKLTLVIAPTGFGKSTLVGSWIAARTAQAAWVTLDENDNDPVRFWTYLITALHNFAPALGKTSLAALAAPQPSTDQSVLVPLINDLAQLTEPCVLVLEDYQVIQSGEINEAVTYLLQNLIDPLHLVILSRSEPDLPLAILRARNELTEIDAADLRFSDEETQAFLHSAIQSDLPSEAVSQLQERTEGWPAGLRLAALALNNQKGQAGLESVLQSFSGSHPYVADYLIQEVFKNQSPNVQTFLLRTGFLDRLNASLCEAVSGIAKSAGLLEKLARESLFIVPLEKSGHQAWYRYNPLFAETIQYLARQRLDAVEITTLFEKASAWYEYHQDYENAVEAALSARLYPRVLTLIEKYIEIQSITAVQTLKRWLSSVPDQYIFEQPEASFTYAQVILFTEDRYAPDMASKLEPYLNAAEKSWGKENNRARLGAVKSLRGITAWWQGDIAKACRLAQQSLDEIPETDIFWRGNSLLISAFGDLNSDDIFAAQDTILEARALLGAANNIYGVLAATQILSAADYWLGELEQARQLNEQIIAEAVGSEDMLDDQGIARLSLANISYEENDLPTAENYLQEALDLATRRRNELLLALVTGRQARLQLVRGKPAQAVDLLESPGHPAAKPQCPARDRYRPGRNICPRPCTCGSRQICAGSPPGIRQPVIPGTRTTDVRPGRQIDPRRDEFRGVETPRRPCGGRGQTRPHPQPGRSPLPGSASISGCRPAGERQSCFDPGIGRWAGQRFRAPVHRRRRRNGRLAQASHSHFIQTRPGHVRHHFTASFSQRNRRRAPRGCRTDRAAQPARAARLALPGGRPVQHRNRPGADRLDQHGQNPRQEYLSQARRKHPG